MKINELFDEFWNLSDEEEPEYLLTWIKGLIKKHPSDLDLRYLYLDVLRFNNLDAEDDQEEPIVMNRCTEVIKDKTNKSISIAKAYCYRGSMKNYGVDRRNDFDKSLSILNGIKPQDVEVRFIKQLIDTNYPFEFRPTLFININDRNMFTFN